MDIKETIKIIIADDSKLTVVGLKTTFKDFPNIKVVNCVENGSLAVKAAKELKPDIILMDIGMPVMDGIQATKEIKKSNPDTKIIMLTSHESEQDVFEALAAGAYSYCMKDIEPDILISVIKSTHEGGCFLDPKIAKIVLNNFKGEINQHKQQDSILTVREIDVLSLIAKGYSNSEISKNLYISMNTVKTHIKNIFQKLEVEDRTHAAIKAFKSEILREEN
ncbi:MAG: response regulator transcription factor [Candidatus Gastranaerophilales bacterium]|nr:response regulator transcription factor [Candidatus Gastranaerophilales bacterium]